jgi:hypothetical protein
MFVNRMVAGEHDRCDDTRSGDQETSELICDQPDLHRFGSEKGEADRQAIIDSLEEKLKTHPKSLVGNKGSRKYLKPPPA